MRELECILEESYQLYFKEMLTKKEFYLYILYVSKGFKVFKKNKDVDLPEVFIREQIQEKTGLGEKIKMYLEKELKREGEYLLKAGIQLLHIENSRYPKRLKHGKYPPLFIFYKGHLGICTKSVAVVGTREYDHLGENLAVYVVGLLNQRRINVVSGSARGIDTIAQKECLRGGGSVAIVTGVGLATFLNSAQGKAYLKHGNQVLFVTEFPLFFKGSRQSFPIRNRLIAGLSLATIMVQAPRKSGALYTADYALAQKKPVFIPMGDYLNERFLGNIDLLKQLKSNENIHLFTDIDALSTCLKIQTTSSSEKTRATSIKQLGVFEEQLLQSIQNAYPNSLHFDQLFQNQKNKNVIEFQNLLFKLLMQDFIDELPGKYYVFKSN